MEKNNISFYLTPEPSQNNNHINAVPWIEKYRPTNFDDIVLDPMNRKLFENILNKNYFPNLLFYGTPGTGKTTTIINLINEYQKKYNKKAKGSIIHLNASDERGIDIIRNNINQFVKSNNIFETGCKFVILDEVDYMTKNAQQALKYLIQTTNNYVHYCLICNYISKIDEPLQNEFICIRFNHLPKKEIHHFIQSITEKENLYLNSEIIETILDIYKSDIRSIINYIQLNHIYYNNNSSINSNEKSDGSICEKWIEKIIHVKIWKELHSLLFYPYRPIYLSNLEEKTKDDFRDFRDSTKIKEYVNPKTEFLNREPFDENIVCFIHEISLKYNMDIKNIILVYFNYIIRNSHFFLIGKPLCNEREEYLDEIKINIITPEFLLLVETIVHNSHVKNEVLVSYFAIFVRKYFHKMACEII